MSDSGKKQLAWITGKEDALSNKDLDSSQFPSFEDDYIEGFVQGIRTICNEIQNEAVLERMLFKDLHVTSGVEIDTIRLD